MRELDILLSDFLAQVYPDCSKRDKAAFRQLLTLSDPALNGYLLGGAEPPDADIARIVHRIRGRPAG